MSQIIHKNKMYPFPDYYTQFGIILKNTPYASFIPLRYEIYEEAIFIIIFLLLLGIEIFTSIIEILNDCMKVKRKMNNNDLIKTLYKQQMESNKRQMKEHFFY
jgi:hypothetical protein